MDELVDQYLALLEVPEEDRLRQRQKLSEVPEDELRRELKALTDILNAAEERISASDERWRIEETQRRELFAAPRDSVQDWLSDLPLVFHPATTGARWSFTPIGAG